MTRLLQAQAAAAACRQSGCLAPRLVVLVVLSTPLRVQTCNCCGQFSLLFEQLAHTLRQFGENNPYVMGRLWAVTVSASVKPIPQCCVQEGQRVLTIDQQTLWKNVFDAFECFQKLVLLCSLL